MVARRTDLPTCTSPKKALHAFLSSCLRVSLITLEPLPDCHLKTCANGMVSPLAAFSACIRATLVRPVERPYSQPSTVRRARSGDTQR